MQGALYTIAGDLFIIIAMLQVQLISPCDRPGLFLLCVCEGVCYLVIYVSISLTDARNRIE